MMFRSTLILGLSAGCLLALPASAHPSHGVEKCMTLPGSPEGYCIPIAQEKTYEIGAPLPFENEELLEWDRFGLDAPPEDHAYSLIEDDIVLYDRTTMKVVKLVKILDSSF